MLSRAPIKINTNNEVENDIECFVNMVIRNTSMSDRNLEQIMEETSKDAKLQTLTRLIIDGWPDEKNEVPKEVFEYWNFRDELSNHNPKGKWDQGTVVRNNNTPNSYVIETPEGQIFKRNRKHLLKTKEDKIEQTSLEEANENNHNDFDNITDEQSLEPSFVRRSERSVKNLLD
ncbi:unnamed protein product [Mytilus coruscus]|uniref:Uncharacterized protein n=1 Tax=Mytilus coruscus TaxID=42192 RepID=A0A6J8BSA1_MYTCO|nr:unnamed protein product [Mytilus coruscus]